MEEGAYDNSLGNGRRIRKPLDNDFLYYAQAGSAGKLMSHAFASLQVTGCCMSTMHVHASYQQHEIDIVSNTLCNVIASVRSGSHCIK